jgi:hypothetical protein
MFGLAHQGESLRDTLVGNEAEKWRLLQLRGKALAQGVIEDRVAGGVSEVGQDDGVFVGELSRMWADEIGRATREAEKRTAAPTIHGKRILCTAAAGACFVAPENSRESASRFKR